MYFPTNVPVAPVNVLFSTVDVDKSGFNSPVVLSCIPAPTNPPKHVGFMLPADSYAPDNVMIVDSFTEDDLTG